MADLNGFLSWIRFFFMVNHYYVEKGKSCLQFMKLASCPPQYLIIYDYFKLSSLSHVTMRYCSKIFVFCCITWLQNAIFYVATTWRQLNCVEKGKSRVMSTIRKKIFSHRKQYKVGLFLGAIFSRHCWQLLQTIKQVSLAIFYFQIIF